MDDTGHPFSGSPGRRERKARFSAGLSRLLRESLTAAAITQKELAASCVVSRAVVRKWLDDEQAAAPSLTHLMMMPPAVRLRVFSLVGRELGYRSREQSAPVPATDMIAAVRELDAATSFVKSEAYLAAEQGVMCAASAERLEHAARAAIDQLERLVATAAAAKRERVIGVDRLGPLKVIK